MGAFAQGVTLVDGLAVRALHALAPGGDTRAVLGAGRIGVGSMLAVARWAVDPDAALGRPLGIVVLVKAAVDQMALGPAAMALLQALEHRAHQRSEEHTSELQSLMRISYAVFCLKKTHTSQRHNTTSGTY